METTRRQIARYFDVRWHRVAAGTVAVFVVFWGITGIVGEWLSVPEACMSLRDVCVWLFSTDAGRTTAAATQFVCVMWFWVVWPWLYLKSRRSRIGELCDRLDALARAPYPFEKFIETAEKAGAIVLRMHDLGAFAENVQVSESIEQAKRGRLFVQISCENKAHSAAQPEFQTFWILQLAAYQPTGKESGQRDSVIPGCYAIANYTRSLWRISQKPVPPCAASPSSSPPSVSPPSSPEQSPPATPPQS
ncbi:MAG: hypothetical protein ACKVS8_10510 [Phycisphaerales bacterium]